MITFGKQALMTCNIMDSNNKTENKATLYKLDPNNSEDRKDVFYSKNTYPIANDFEKAKYDIFPKNDFYIIQNNKTKEIMSCAEVSSHYGALNTPYNGQYTLIEEINGNKKFDNAIEPMLAYITQNAQNKSDEYVVTAFDEYKEPSIESNEEFSQVQTGEYVISKEKFHPFLKKTESNYKMEYLV